MKTLNTTVYLLLVLTLNFNSQAQDMDYHPEGYVSSMNGSGIDLTYSSLTYDPPIAPKPEEEIPLVSQRELNKIWKEMESLMLNVIDLEVEVLDLRKEQLKVIPFSKINTKSPMTREEYFDGEEEFTIDRETDRLKYEMLQVARHLNRLCHEVSCIRDEIEMVNPHLENGSLNELNPNSSTIVSAAAKTLGTDNFTHRLNEIKYTAKPTLQVEDPIERFWKEMEEMAIQVMDLEVEISDLRIHLSNLKHSS